MPHVWIFCVTNMNEPYHAHERVMVLMRMKHVTLLSESCRAVWINHATHMNESCLACKWFTSRAGKGYSTRYVLYLWNESSRITHDKALQRQWCFNTSHDSENSAVSSGTVSSMTPVRIVSLRYKGWLSHWVYFETEKINGKFLEE